MKVLINTPSIGMLGGVANHYKGLRPYWKNTVHYNHIGSRNKLPGSLLFPLDVIKFFIRLTLGRYDLVVLNPSLTAQSVIRDGIFLLIASFFSAKKVVFFHGWEPNIAEKISHIPKLFSWVYGKAAAIIVLASSFKVQLEEWGIKVPIHLTTTKFDDRLLEGKEIRSRTHVKSLLFLARVEEEKGIFVALSALKILQPAFPDLRLKVVGGGGALEEAKRFVSEEDINNVEFCGVLSGEALSKSFMSTDIYLLPTWHGEGMPTSILEAMAFGLPVITRPVGGVRDFFIDGQMGSLLDSKSPIDFAMAIQKLLDNNDILGKISTFNIKYAHDNFAASRVAAGLEAIFKSVLEKKYV